MVIIPQSSSCPPEMAKIEVSSLQGWIPININPIPRANHIGPQTSVLPNTEDLHAEKDRRGWSMPRASRSSNSSIPTATSMSCKLTIAEYRVILYAKERPFLGDGPGGRAFGEDILWR